ncbi:hypothetical protein EV359DRAFT_69097, partial [Lentinula novae-zelandiae]
MFSTQNPPAIQRIPWPASEEVVGERGSDEEEYGTRRRKLDNYDQWIINDGDFGWLVEPEVTISQIRHDQSTGVESWIASDGRAYIVYLIRNDEPSSEELPSDSKNASNINLSENDQLQTQKLDNPRLLMGNGMYGWKQRRVEPEEHGSVYFEPRRAVRIAINAKFSLIAVGMLGGGIQYTTFPADEDRDTQPVQSTYWTCVLNGMEWSSDGYVLAVGWQHGWGLFSVGGRCLASGFGVEDVDEQKFQDTFMNSVVYLNVDAVNQSLTLGIAIDEQLFVIPFAKSATTGQHSPDNTRYAFLQLEDRALVPQSYLAANWPIRYSSLSSDGRLIAIAGRRGLVHYSASSGRWKLFTDPVQEQAFSVQGGLLWFHHVLVAAVEVSKTHQIRLYSRDLELSNQNVLHREVMPSPVIILSLVDNSLLVYCADNTLFHFLIIPTADTIKLHLCGSITFNGVIATPSAVRMLSWMIPSAQKQLGDPVNDLAVATVLMVVGGQLVLLRPRK